MEHVETVQVARRVDGGGGRGWEISQTLTVNQWQDLSCTELSCTRLTSFSLFYANLKSLIFLKRVTQSRFVPTSLERSIVPICHFPSKPFIIALIIVAVRFARRESESPWADRCNTVDLPFYGQLVCGAGVFTIKGRWPLNEILDEH